MELQEIRMVWVLGLALLWLVALLVGSALAALAGAIDRARAAVAATKPEPEPRAAGGVETLTGDTAAVVHGAQAAWRVRC